MTEKNNSIVTEIDLFLKEKGISVWNDVDIFGEVMAEEMPLRDTLKNISDLPFCETETPSIEIKGGLMPKNKSSIISFGAKKDGKKVVDVFVVSSSLNYFSDEVTFFENKIIEDLSYGRTELFDFKIKFIHLGFQDILKIFNKIKEEKIVVLFLSDTHEEVKKHCINLIKNHTDFRKEYFYFFSQNDDFLKQFEYRLDLFFNFIKYEINLI